MYWKFIVTLSRKT